MKIVVLDEPVTYDGTQLSTAFFDARGADGEDAVVAFEGPCEVPTENLVDLEDAEAGAHISSTSMAHLLIEHRGLALDEAVWRQRLLVHLAARWVMARAGVDVEVRGDDLFVRDGKLSVSIATRSPRGCLMHLGLNVETEGAPVRAAGLRDLRISAREFLRTLSRLYDEEIHSVAHAVTKVRAAP